MNFFSKSFMRAVARPIRILAAVVLAASVLAAEHVAHAQKADPFAAVNPKPAGFVISTSEGPRHVLVLPAGKGPHPTVIVLHGSHNTAATTGFVEAAARHGFAAVFPESLASRWHDGRAGGPSGPDDVAFMHKLVALLIADGVTDPHHIYLAGISNGGMMSFALACKESDLYAGIGTVIANMPAGIEPCRPKPMPVVMINGTADPVVPFRGGEVGLKGGHGNVWSVDQTIALFARLDSCRESKAESLPHHAGLETTHVTRIAWLGCQQGTSVTLYRVEGGGHAQPGRPSFAPNLGPSNQDFVAAEAIMDVFADAARPRYVTTISNQLH